MPVSWYEQLMAAGGPQMLATSNVWGVDAADRHVLWCFVLQTPMDRCTQLVLHPLRNVQPVQLVVQQMAESAVVLPCVADDVSIQYMLELVCGGLGCPSKNGVAIVQALRYKSVDQRSRWLSIKWTSDPSALAKLVKHVAQMLAMCLSRHKKRSNVSVMPKTRTWSLNDADSRNDVPFWSLIDISPHFMGEIPQNPNFGCVNKHFQV